MSKLSTKARNSLPKSEFGEPGERKYPMPDHAHAANAKARASQQYNKGHISLKMLHHIDEKADHILHKK
jgi:hypothetical protein